MIDKEEFQEGFGATFTMEAAPAASDSTTSKPKVDFGSVTFGDPTVPPLPESESSSGSISLDVSSSEEAEAPPPKFSFPAVPPEPVEEKTTANLSFTPSVPEATSTADQSEEPKKEEEETKAAAPVYFIFGSTFILPFSMIQIHILEHSY